MEGLEKVIMCDGGNNSAMTAAMMANGCNNQNQFMNNPFAYLILLAFMRNMGLGGEEMANSQNAEIAALRNQISDNQNTNLLQDAVSGNTAAISQLATNMNMGFDNVSKSICDVRAGIERVAGEVGYSAEKVINAVNLGDCGVIRAIENCCCQTQKSILEQTNMLNNGLNTLGFQNQQGFTNLGFQNQQGFAGIQETLRAGFCEVGFNAEKNTRDIIQSNQDGVRSVLAVINGIETERLREQINDAKRREQTALLSAEIKEATTANCFGGGKITPNGISGWYLG